MLDKMLDTYSKAIESTFKLQQEMLGSWTDQWPLSQPQAPEPKPAAMPSSSGSKSKETGVEQIEVARRKCAELVTDLLNRHRETLDEQYKAGIRTLEDVFQASANKDPEQFRRFSEELWRRNLKTLETAVESQMHDIQAVLQKWIDAAATGVQGSFEQICGNS